MTLIGQLIKHTGAECWLRMRRICLIIIITRSNLMFMACSYIFARINSRREKPIFLRYTVDFFCFAHVHLAVIVCFAHSLQMERRLAGAYRQHLLTKMGTFKRCVILWWQNICLVIYYPLINNKYIHYVFMFSV